MTQPEKSYSEKSYSEIASRALLMITTLDGWRYDGWGMDRTRWIVAARDSGATLEEIGRVLGVTRERVRHLERQGRAL